MYEVTSSPFVSRTRATLRSAEFGFLGVVVYTRMQTPRFCGHACIAGVFDFLRTASRPCRTSWLMVGMTLHRRERRQNSHFIAERPFLVKHLGLTCGGHGAVAFRIDRWRIQAEYRVERLDGLAARREHFHPRVVVETCPGRDQPAH